MVPHPLMQWGRFITEAYQEVTLTIDLTQPSSNLNVSFFFNLIFIAFFPLPFSLLIPASLPQP